MAQLPRASAGRDLADVFVHHARRGKDGPKVLLVHAIGFDHTTWDPILPYLEDRYDLALIDLPGHGQSGKPADADYGPLSLGRRALAVLDQLGWERAALVGNSLGGGVSLAAVLQAPERVTALALVNSVGLRPGLPALGRLAGIPFLPVLSGLAPSLAVRVGLESCRARWGSVTSARCTSSRAYLRSPEGRGAFFRALRQLYGPDLEEMARRYPEIRCPTLVLHGERDPLIRLRHAEQLSRMIPGAELIRLPGCGHFPQEECPEKVGAPLRRFLDQALATTA
jgi:pimeloyl-ACP methyl ester carboxylesterase